MNIVLADDDPTYLETRSQVLRKLGHNVYTCPSGQQARDLITHRSGEIDAAIVDIIMESKDSGWEVADFLSRTYPTIPVILVTAFPKAGLRNESSSAGVFRVLTKDEWQEKGKPILEAAEKERQRRKLNREQEPVVLSVTRRQVRQLCLGFALLALAFSFAFCGIALISLRGSLVGFGVFFGAGILVYETLTLLWTLRAKSKGREHV